MDPTRVAAVVTTAWALGACRHTDAVEHDRPAPSAPQVIVTGVASTEARAPFEQPPGVVIDHGAASDKAYVGSPSIAVLPDGSYVASHDWFGPGTTKDRTEVFGSTDRGGHWSKLSEVDGQWWSTLFVHDNRLYLIGTSKEFGAVVIRRSSDGGRSWTSPDSAASGRLTDQDGYHCAPVPVVEHGGRLWRAVEHVHERKDVGSKFKVLVISTATNADLLDRSSWTFATPVSGDAAWLGGDFENWLEGNAVVSPSGDIVDVLRVNSKASQERVAVAHVSADGKTVVFDPTKDFVEFSGGSKKFTIRFDPQTKLYWTLADVIAKESEGGATDNIRNTLALQSSTDLQKWSQRKIVLHHDDRKKHAFQYVDWLFDGDDIIAVSRTAYDDATGGAHSFHDANYLTFHRIARFRD